MKVKIAFVGVRRVGCTLPIQLGSSPSRPALKTSRALGVRAGDQRAHGRGQAGEVGEDGERRQQAVGDVDERDRRGPQLPAL